MSEFEKLKTEGYTCVILDSMGRVGQSESPVDMGSLRETSRLMRECLEGKTTDEAVDEWVLRKRKEYIEKHGSMNYVKPPNVPLLRVSYLKQRKVEE